MASLKQLLPDADTVLALATPVLAHYVLRTLLNDVPAPLVRQNVLSVYGGRINIHPQHVATDEYPGRSREVEVKVLEAWAWMESQAILIRTDRNAGHGFATLSLTGIEFYADERPQTLIALRRISKGDLHKALHDEALSLFWQRNFDTCIFAAFKAVEVAVRDSAKLSADDIGVPLMRKAFGPSGALADATLTGGEREAAANLFAGAIGMFKSPNSHRYLSYDAETCADVLTLASRLLYMVDKAKR